MLYAVGTHIDLRDLNQQAVEQPQPQPELKEKPRLDGYEPGTRFVFVQDLSERTVLKITPKLFVVNQHAAA